MSTRMQQIKQISVSDLTFFFQGQAGVTEDRRHRAIYRTLSDSEAKLQFFSARQVACRILGSHGYLCETVSVGSIDLLRVCCDWNEENEMYIGICMMSGKKLWGILL